MATVTLTTVWLNLASNPADCVQLVSTSGLVRQRQTPGDVRALAGGRFRLIRSGSRTQAWGLSLPFCTRAEVDWLEAKEGLTVCARDDLGHKFFAVWTATGIAESTFSDDEAAVEIALQEVTFSEAV